MTYIVTKISYEKKVPEWVQHEDGELSLSGYPIRIKRLRMFFPLRVESDYNALSLPFSTLEAAKNEALYLAKEIDVFTGNQDCFGSFRNRGAHRDARHRHQNQPTGPSGRVKCAPIGGGAALDR